MTSAEAAYAVRIELGCTANSLLAGLAQQVCFDWQASPVRKFATKLCAAWQAPLRANILAATVQHTYSLPLSQLPQLWQPSRQHLYRIHTACT